MCEYYSLCGGRIDVRKWRRGQAKGLSFRFDMISLSCHWSLKWLWGTVQFYMQIQRDTWTVEWACWEVTYANLIGWERIVRTQEREWAYMRVHTHTNYSPQRCWISQKSGVRKKGGKLIQRSTTTTGKIYGPSTGAANYKETTTRSKWTVELSRVMFIFCFMMI